MIFERNKEGRGVNRKRGQRLMRVMGIEALVPRPGTSKAAPGHKTYPYLLRGLAITEPNHVWASDITYVPMAIIDWASRAVLAWRLRTRSTAAFASKRLRRLCSDMGSREYSTPIKARSSPAPPSPASLKPLASRFRWTDAAGSWITFSSNGWRSIKYEEIHLKAYADGREARADIGSWIDLLQFSTPPSGDEQSDADGRVARRHGQNNANALPAYPQQKQQKAA
jgi:putative transposase